MFYLDLAQFYEAFERPLTRPSHELEKEAVFDPLQAAGKRAGRPAGLKKNCTVSRMESAVTRRPMHRAAM